MFCLIFLFFYSLFLFYGSLYKFPIFWVGYFTGVFLMLVRNIHRAKYQIIKLTIDDDNVYLEIANKDIRRKIYLPICNFKIKFVEIWPRVYTLSILANKKLVIRVFNRDNMKIETMEKIFLFFKNNYNQTT